MVDRIARCLSCRDCCFAAYLKERRETTRVDELEERMNSLEKTIKSALITLSGSGTTPASAVELNPESNEKE